MDPYQQTRTSELPDTCHPERSRATLNSLTPELAFILTMSSIEQHPKLRQALSMVPYSPLFGILWPIIVDQASYDTRRQLRQINDYFAGLCYPHRRSDRAKDGYIRYYGNPDSRPNIPLVLNLSTEVEWRCWGADKAGFNSVASFRAFCAIGDVDPDSRREWKRMTLFHPYFDEPPNHIWLSRSKDLIFETSCNPLTAEGYCHFFGLTGIADKAIPMYNYMVNGQRGMDPESDEMGTIWDEMSWSRDYC